MCNMCKFLSSVTLFALFTLNLSACSKPSVTEQRQEQRQTTQVEQYSSDNGIQRQCNRSVVIQNNGKTEVHQSSKCE